MSKTRIIVSALFVLLWAANAFVWSFAVCGDSRDDKDGIFPQILSAVDDSDMEFLLHTGDMVNKDSPGEWDLYREATARFRKPLRAVIGNHELYGGGTPEKFAERFGLPGASWSFTHKDAHIAIVDNAKGTFPDNTLAWLDRDLAAHPRERAGSRPSSWRCTSPRVRKGPGPTGPGTTTRSGARSSSRS